jgi:diguanylate cyclase (GGDEF)-like protein
MDKELQKITKEICEEMNQLEIVLPELYKDIFFQKLKSKNLIIENGVIDVATEYALSKILKIKEQTEESVDSFSKNLDKSLIAISEMDSQKINLIQKEVAILKSKLDSISEELYLDELTQVKNRKWLYKKFLLDKTFMNNGTMVFIDLNKFKIINDTYGHLAGDKTLKVFSVLLNNLDDFVTVRYAGDEFLLFTNLGIEETDKKVKTLIKYLGTKELRLSDENKIKISFSYGITQYEYGDELDLKLEEADNNMYKSKKE